MRNAWLLVFAFGLSGLASADVQDCSRPPRCGTNSSDTQRVVVTAAKEPQPAPVLQVRTVPMSSLMTIGTKGLGSASERQTGGAHQVPAQPTPAAPGDEAQEPAPAENNSSANR